MRVPVITAEPLAFPVGSDGVVGEVTGADVDPPPHAKAIISDGRATVLMRILCGVTGLVLRRAMPPLCLNEYLNYTWGTTSRQMLNC
jgi:hypothetical protein